MDTRIIAQALSTRANGYHWDIDDQLVLLKLIGELSELALEMSKKVEA